MIYQLTWINLKKIKNMKVLNMIFKGYFPLILTFGIGIFSCQDKEEPIVEEDNQEIVRDIDGNVYDLVTIQGVKWLLQNLRTSKYRDGREIPEVQDDLAWSELTTGAYSWYNNENTANIGHGKLYNWQAVSCCDICPEGFRVPTTADFERIRLFIGEFFCDEADCPPYLTWISKAGTMEGMRLPTGGFLNSELAYTGFWTSETNLEGEAIFYELKQSFSGEYVGRFLKSNINTSSGLSIKCVEVR
jgi:uncharacterized protein (TIGR02145 family)